MCLTRRAACETAAGQDLHQATDQHRGELVSQSLPERILAVYEQLVTRPGGYVSLVDLRAHLGSVPLGDLNRTLIVMDDRRQIALEPDPDQRGLTPEAHRTAVKLAGRDMHLMRVIVR